MQIYPETEPFTHLAKVPFGVKQYIVPPVQPNDFIGYQLMYPFFYLRIYDDLQAAYGVDNYGAARKHYLDAGIYEGRCASPFFDPKYYLERYGDLRVAFGSDNYPAATRHFLLTGFKEGRQGSRLFDIDYYVRSNPDIQRVFGYDYSAAFWHWKTFHHLEHRATNSEGIIFEIKENNWAFGKTDRNMLFINRQTREDFICLCGFGLLIAGIVTKDIKTGIEGGIVIAANCREYEKDGKTGPTFPSKEVYDQYQIDQAERNKNTA